MQIRMGAIRHERKGGTRANLNITARTGVHTHSGGERHTQTETGHKQTLSSMETEMQQVTNESSVTQLTVLAVTHSFG